MSAIIEELKKDHKTMLKVAEDMAAKSKPTSAEIAAFIATLKSALLAHLKKEDEKLYPKLKLLAEKNTSLKGILNVFADDMTKVSTAALAFIEKYSKGGDASQFVPEYSKFMYTLKTRIRREEESLYPEYKD